MAEEKPKKLKESNKSALNEDDKFDIEDIKDPLDEEDKPVEAVKTESVAKDLDLEDVVSEDSEKEESPEEQKDEAPTEEPEKDELEKVVEEPKEEPVAEEEKKEKPKKDKKPFNWKIFGIVLISVLVTAALVLGGLYWYKQKNKPAEEPAPAPTNNVEINVSKPATTEKTVYVTAEGGLNLRKEPNTSAQILASIPYGTKLNVTETQGTWYKTTYNSLTGWVDSTYTAATNPLVYQNTTYKFEITFPADWVGYKLFPMTADSTETAAYHVGLPTKDTAYIPPTGVTKGYASMFAVSVYTPAQWTALQAEEGIKPTLAVQNQQWVVAYSLPNGVTATDLTNQSKETSSVVKTIKFY